ncbi:hypothetical protein [Bacillus atrophaeus]|uniref:hypothetical protein n=1 Tax=Bacillus atrophaeus TaxID=1452 RepID=UPI000779E832|nr:hypothetical protein [Bacillus atrophaeus]KAA6453802.1 hypothetical protein DX926_05045 [Bacillus atrophaeus]KYD04842.1 hypothetical protein B4144_1445 [Bacillus atrophaeus]MCY8512400.1 hypothetical protein [Bacillus atrophaeus]MCY8516358.1 hypothetical protein [Bacillus atrophaeus]MCY8992912.1 hypothetical protein [Bacillus atrophaeus]
MKELTIFITELINRFHDVFISLCEMLGLNLTDKQMHFWVIGLFGILFFGLTQAVFKWLSKWSVTALSFIYTLTVLFVIVFAIELQQKVTGRGNMEFQDAAEGLKGFLIFFIILMILKGLLASVKKVFKGEAPKNTDRHSRFRR